MLVIKGSNYFHMKMENVDVKSENKIKILDFIELLAGDLYLYACSIAYSSAQFARKFIHHVQLAAFLDTISDKLESHPILKLAAFGTAACFSVPAVLFIAFAIISLLLTFSGFVILEGILLVIGGLCLCACLISMLMVISVLAVTFGTFYFIATKLRV